MTAMERLTASGARAGEAAGSWVIDGNTSEAAALRVLADMADGLFEVPAPLSGEWADGWTPERVCEDAGVTPANEDEMALCLTAWEDAYHSAYCEEVDRAARHTAGLSDEWEPEADLGEQSTPFGGIQRTE